MSYTKPTFEDLRRAYPAGSKADVEILTGSRFENTCAVRMGIALSACVDGFMSSYEEDHDSRNSANRIRITPLKGTVARSAWQLADHLLHDSGWNHERIRSRRDAIRLQKQGIIFWRVTSNNSYGMPNHIDLWDPKNKTLLSCGKRSMMWCVQRSQQEILRDIVFWPL